MNEEDIQRLEANGWKVSDVQEFLKLTNQEMRSVKAIAEMRLLLGNINRAINWLYTRREMFDGHSAWALCETDEGFHRVMDEIERIKFGVY